MSYFWDNLIPLHGRLNKHQYAGWTPIKFAQSGLGCRLLSSVMIKMPDGVHLEADIYLPKVLGKYPAIVQFSTYNKVLHTVGVPKGPNEVGTPTVITDRGYVQIIINRRGIGKSEGKILPLFSEQETLDFKHCIEWAAAQEWCSGDVCLFGTSYYGMNQPMVAELKPKGLRAMFANEICTDFFRHLAYYGEVFNSEFFSLWFGANFTNNEIKRSMPPFLRAILSYFINRPWLWEWFLKRKISSIYTSMINRHINKDFLELFTKAMLQNKEPSEKNSFSEGPYKNLETINIPFVVVQNLGMWNLHQFGSYDLFSRASTPNDKKYLILGQPEYDLPVLSWQLEALAFFDYIVKGTDNGYNKQPQVRYWLQGKNQYLGANNFPLQNAKRIKFYPSKITDDKNILSMQSVENGFLSWAAIPLGAKILPDTETIIPHKLSFEFKTDKDIKIVGPVKLSLNFSCNEIDSYIVARVSHFDSENKNTILGMGAMRPARRKINEKLSSECEIVHDFTKPEALNPNEIVNLQFSITPIATYIKAGEKLILEIASRTDLLKGKFAEGYIHMDLCVPPYFSKNTIYFGKDTYLEVDILD